MEILQLLSESNNTVGEISLDGQGFGPDYIKDRLDPYSSKEHMIIKETISTTETYILKLLKYKPSRG